MEKTDIQNREDILLLLHDFYSQVMDDEFIGYIFRDVAHLDLESHIPRIADFWESVLLHTTPYAHNAMRTHLELHSRTPLQEAHFDRWMLLWHHSLHSRFEGPNTLRAEFIARNIASVMMSKIKGGELLTINSGVVC